MSRRLAREVALKTIFQLDITGEDDFTFLGKYFKREGILDKLEQEFAFDLVKGVIEKRAELDDLLGPYLKKWETKRLPAVDRSILRLALHEIIFTENTSFSIFINEAIELAKKYSDKKAAKYINGVLDKFCQDLKKKEEKNNIMSYNGVGHKLTAVDKRSDES